MVAVPLDTPSTGILMMVVLPVPPLTEPFVGTVAIALEELHVIAVFAKPGRVTDAVIFVMLPLDTVKVGGCICMTGGAFTRTVHVALYPPFSVATVMVAMPGETPLKLPD
jgi:hypothetical protein